MKRDETRRNVIASEECRPSSKEDKERVPGKGEEEGKKQEMFSGEKIKIEKKREKKKRRKEKRNASTTELER